MDENKYYILFFNNLMITTKNVLRISRRMCDEGNTCMEHRVAEINLLL